MKMRVDAAGLAYRGRTASIGFARGPFIRIGSGANRQRSPGSPAEEALALREAIQLSSAQIAELAAAAGGEAAQILEFQVALLEDEDFLEPVFATIDQGVPADSPGRRRSTSRSQTIRPQPTNISRRARPTSPICAIASWEYCAAARGRR